MADTLTASEALFASSDEQVRATYARLLAALRQIGPFEEEPKKTSIHLTHTVGFAGVHPRKSYLILNLRTDHPLESSRIAKVEQVSKHRYHCELKLAAPTEIDEELLGWLTEAYRLG
jgi:uncharacterized protein DUF5655